MANKELGLEIKIIGRDKLLAIGQDAKDNVGLLLELLQKVGRDKGIPKATGKVDGLKAAIEKIAEARGFTVAQEQVGQLKAGVADLQKEIERMFKQLEAQGITRNFGALIKRAKELNKEIKGIADIDVEPKTIEELRQSLKDARVALERTADPEEFDELLQVVGLLKAQLAEFNAEQRAAQKQFQDSKFAAGSFKALQAETREGTKQLREMSVGVNATQEEFDKLQAELIENKQALASFDRELRGSGELVGEYSRGIINALARVGAFDELQEKLEGLEKQHHELVQEGQRLRKEWDKAKKEGPDAFEKVSIEMLENRDALEQVEKSMRDVNDELKKAGIIGQESGGLLLDSFKKAGALFAGFGVLNTIKRTLGEMGELSLELGRGWGGVNTVLQVSETELEAIRANVESIAIDRGFKDDIETMPKTFFDIASATNDAEKSQIAFGDAVEASRAGQAELNLVADAGVGIWGALGDQVSGTREVYDVLFATQRRGKTTIAELAEELPKVIADGNKAGQSYISQASALAALTQAGLSTVKAGNVLQATFRQLSDPERFKALEKLGVKAFDENTKSMKPLEVIMAELDERLEGLTQEDRLKALGEIGLEANAAKGFAILTQNLELYQDITDDITKNSAGELQRQFLLSQNAADNLDGAVNELMLTLVQEFGPIVEEAGNGLAGLARTTAALIRLVFDHKEILVILGGIIALNNSRRIAAIGLQAKELIVKKASLIITKLQTVARGVMGIATDLLTGKIGLATAAQQLWNLTLAANPIGAVIVAVTALIALIVVLRNRQEELTEEQKRFNELSEKFASAFAKSRVEADRLFDALRRLKQEEKDGADNKALQAKVIERLNSKYGEYIGNLNLEKASLDQVDEAQKRVIAGLRQKIALQLKEQEITEVLQKASEQQFIDAQKIARTLELPFAEVSEFLEEVREKGTENLDALSESSQDIFKRIRDESASARKDISGFGIALESGLGGPGNGALTGLARLFDASGVREFSTTTEAAFNRIVNVEKSAQEEIETLNTFFDDFAGDAIVAFDDTADAGKGFGKKLSDVVEETKKDFKGFGDEIAELQAKLTELRTQNEQEGIGLELAQLGDSFAKAKADIEKSAAEIIESEKSTAEERELATRARNEVLIELEKEFTRLRQEIIDNANAENRTAILEGIEEISDARELKLKEQLARDQITQEEFDQRDFERQRNAIETKLKSIELEIETEASLNAELIALRQELVTTLAELEAERTESLREQALERREIRRDELIESAEQLASIFGDIRRAREIDIADRIYRLEERSAARVKEIEDSTRTEEEKERLIDQEKEALKEAVREQEVQRKKQAAIEQKATAAAALAAQARIVVTQAETLANMLKAVSEGGKLPFPASLVAIVSILAALTAGFVSAKTLFTSSSKLQNFADGGELPIGTGGIIQGPTHDEGGVRFIYGNTPVEVEGGGRGSKRGELIINRGIWRRPDFVNAISWMNAKTGGHDFFRRGRVNAYGRTFETGGVLGGGPLSVPNFDALSVDNRGQAEVNNRVAQTLDRIAGQRVVLPMDDFDDKDSERAETDDFSTLT